MIKLRIVKTNLKTIFNESSDLESLNGIESNEKQLDCSGFVKGF